ncbi:mediator of RNA polymerase II transcription subunit 9 [Porites harrisoni]
MASYETEEIDVAKEFNLLPVIFETIQALQRTSDPQELTKKVNTFRSKLQHCRTLLDKIPGLEMSGEEQKEMLNKYQAQYKEKCELLRNYRNLPVFAEAFLKEKNLSQQETRRQRN